MASAEESGQFIIDFADQSQNVQKQVYSEHTSLISGGSKAMPTGETLKAMPKVFEGLTERKMRKVKGRVVVSFRSDATDIIESEESQFEIPYLEYDLTTNKLVGRGRLTQENMTGFTQAGTVDVTCTAGVKTQLCYRDVPRGLYWTLDPQGKIHAYMGDDTA